VTRWWTYAVLAIAIVAGSVRVQASPQGHERCELRESANHGSAARKRNDPPAQIARRSATGATPLAVVPDVFDLAAPARACVVVSFVIGEGRATTRVVRACSRAPPVG
jgi:hypothetical protein